MSKDLERRLRESVAAFKALSRPEQLSVQAAQAINYVASELFMGVIENAGDFATKKASALQSLRWIEGALMGRIAVDDVSSSFLQRIWRLTPEHRTGVTDRVRIVIADLERLDKSEERAVRIV